PFPGFAGGKPCQGALADAGLAGQVQCVAVAGLELGERSFDGRELRIPPDDGPSMSPGGVHVIVVYLAGRKYMRSDVSLRAKGCTGEASGAADVRLAA